MKNKLIEGSIWKSLLVLSIPMVFANLLQTAYQLVDTFWVGRLGTNAMAAVSISFPIMFLIFSLSGGIFIAGTVFVAQFKGKNDIESTNHIASQTLLMALFLSIVLGSTAYIFSPYLIKLMGADINVFLSAVSYVRISFLGMFFLFSYVVFQSLMRGIGEVKTPLYVVLFTVILNIILDPLFIFGYGFIPKLAVSGAALATIISQGISAFIGLGILFFGKYDLKIRIKDLKPDLLIIKKMFLIGLPASIEQSTRAISLIIMTFLVSNFGTITIASYGIGMRVFSFVIIPAVGLAMATSTLVGQNIGASKIQRAEKIVKVSVIASTLILFIVSLFVFFFARNIASFFIPDELDTIKQSSVFLKIIAFSFPFLAIQQILGAAFKGSGNTRLSMMISIIPLWIFQFPLAYVLSKYSSMGQVGIWVAILISNFVSALLCFIYFMKGDWKNRKLTEEVKFSEKVNEELTIEELS